MKKKILFIADWPDEFDNVRVLQDILDKEHSEKYEWKVWSCKKKESGAFFYRWKCYIGGAIYAIKQRKNYDAVFIWQQMVGFSLFEIVNILPFKLPNVYIFTYVYNSNTVVKHFKKHLVKNAFKHAAGIIWPSSEMSLEVKGDFPQYKDKTHFTLMPIFDVINLNFKVDESLDDPAFRNGIFSGGMSERDFDSVIRAFNDTKIPVTIVCPDNYPITEKVRSPFIRILPFSKVSHEQYYALAGQAFCILISVINEKSPCGMLIIAFGMANSIPVIATDSYGVRDYLVNNENGLLFKYGRVEDMVTAYERLLNEPGFKENIVKNAKDTVARMTPQKFIHELVDIMEK